MAVGAAPGLAGLGRCHVGPLIVGVTESIRECRKRRFWPITDSVPVAVLATIIFEVLTVGDLIV